MLETNVDKILDLLKKKEQISIQDIARLLGTTAEQIDMIAKFLEEEDIITIKYKLLTPYLAYNMPKFHPIKDISRENVLSAVDLRYHEVEELVSKVKYLIIKNKVKLHFGNVEWKEINDTYQELLSEYSSLDSVSGQKKLVLEEKIRDVKDSMNTLMINILIKKAEMRLSENDFANARKNTSYAEIQIKNLSDTKKQHEFQTILYNLNLRIGQADLNSNGQGQPKISAENTQAPAAQKDKKEPQTPAPKNKAGRSSMLIDL